MIQKKEAGDDYSLSLPKQKAQEKYWARSATEMKLAQGKFKPNNWIIFFFFPTVYSLSVKLLETDVEFTQVQLGADQVCGRTIQQVKFSTEMLLLMQ